MPISPRLKLAALALAATGVLAALGGCATNPVTGGTDIVTMSEAQEIELGRKMHPQILQQYGRFDDEQLQQYVSEVGQRIAAKSHRPNLQYTFTVLDGDEVNAFALPGGYVYITRGIMAYLNSEAELAAVIGHEIGHVTARHSVRQQAGATAAGVGAMVVGILTGSGDLANVANMAGGALISGYGRDMELEADELGAEYLNRIGYEPEAMIDVVRLLKNQEMLEVQMARQENRKPRVYHGVFASHPDNDTRLQEVVKAAGKVQNAEDRPPNRDLYLSHINGLPMGDSRAQGVVRGSRFYHADLGITLAFPTGWIVDNQRTKVVAYTAGEGRRHGGVGRGAAARHGAEGVPGADAAGRVDDRGRAAAGEQPGRLPGRRAQHDPALGQPGAGERGRGLLQQPRLHLPGLHAPGGGIVELRAGLPVEREDVPASQGQRVHGRRTGPDPGHPGQ